jgi:hypothetical protein
VAARNAASAKEAPMSGLMNGPKNRPRNWQETMKATALAAEAERAVTPVRNVADASYTWNAYDVWLTRIQSPVGNPARVLMADPVTRSRQDARAAG